jgi:MYXO-CTERM domain-containing protein
MEQCQATASGCPIWAAAGACAAGETCQGGACIPPCQNECTLGAGKCTSGAPSVCEKAPTGCTVWKAQSACAVDATCLEGSCRTRCASSELELCPAGLECTGLPSGERLCLPSTGPADAGVTPSPGADAGTAPKPKLVAKDDPPVSEGSTTSTSGCGCSTGAEGMSAFALLGVLGMIRRSRQKGDRQLFRD